jgi:hypothetical protein
MGFIMMHENRKSLSEIPNLEMQARKYVWMLPSFIVLFLAFSLYCVHRFQSIPFNTSMFSASMPLRVLSVLAVLGIAASLYKGGVK